MAWASHMALVVKNLLAIAGDIRIRGQSLNWEDPLEEGMTTLSSILTCKIPGTEEPGELQFVGLHRVGHD